MTSNDRSYRILVVLQRDDREKYWMFSCPRCKADIHEINNAAMLAMTDAFNQTDSVYGHSFICPTRDCRIRYYFKLSD